MAALRALVYFFEEAVTSLWRSRLINALSVGTIAVSLFVLGAFLTSIYVLRVAKQIFWGPPSPDPHFHDLPDAEGPEWAALAILVLCLVLFGVIPGIALGPVDTATVQLLIRLGVLR